MYTIREIIKNADQTIVSEAREITPNDNLLSWKDKARIKESCSVMNFAKMKPGAVSANTDNVEFESIDLAGQAKALEVAKYEIACIVFGLSLNKEYVATDVEKLIEYVEGRDFLGLKLQVEESKS